MSTYVAFTPSAQTVFQFQPILNGQRYICSVPWNSAAQRYYISIQDTANNVLLYRPLMATGPRFLGNFTWAAQRATASLSLAHGLPLGQVVRLRATQTGTAFDGDFLAWASSPTQITYSLANNPGGVQPLSGFAGFPVNLAPGLGWLLFHVDTQQFEFASS